MIFSYMIFFYAIEIENNILILNKSATDKNYYILLTKICFA